MEKDRSQIIIKSGWFFILTNFFLAVFNLIVGLISGSLAITSDAAHSLIDAVSGVIIIVSEKFASSKKFATRRVQIERFTTIIIALIIIAVGLHIIVESIEKIIAPETVDYGAPAIIVLTASIVAKYALAVYLKRTGRACRSDVLIASGAETLNDTWISVAVLVSAIIYLIWQVNLESYLSLIIAVIIIKIGLEFIFPHLSRHHHHPLESNPDHDHCSKNHTKSY